MHQSLMPRRQASYPRWRFASRDMLNLVGNVDSVNNRRKILKMHNAVLNIQNREEGDAGRSAAAKNIYCQDCGLGPPKIDWHRSNKVDSDLTALEAHSAAGSPGWRPVNPHRPRGHESMVDRKRPSQYVIVPQTHINRPRGGKNRTERLRVRVW